MAVLTEKTSIGDAVKWEANPNYSRSNVTIAYQGSVKRLEVVGQITATGKYRPLDPAGSTGIEVAKGISLLDVDASGGDQVGLILNGDSLVDMDALVWPEGISAGAKEAAIAELAEVNIKAVGQSA